MTQAKVYFTDFRTKLGEGLPSKLKRLIRAAEIQQIDMAGKFVEMCIRDSIKIVAKSLRCTSI